MSFVWLRNKWGKEGIESAHAKKKILPAVRDGRWVNRLDFLCLADITLWGPALTAIDEHAVSVVAVYWALAR